MSINRFYITSIPKSDLLCTFWFSGVQQFWKDVDHSMVRSLFLRNLQLNIVHIANISFDWICKNYHQCCKLSTTISWCLLLFKIINEVFTKVRQFDCFARCAVGRRSVSLCLSFRSIVSDRWERGEMRTILLTLLPPWLSSLVVQGRIVHEYK